MPWSPEVPFRPGIDVIKTAVLNGQGWSESDCIRFRGGLPEKDGGWAHLNDTPLIGSCRGMMVWADLDGVPYLAAGSEQRLQVLALGGIYDITPLEATNNPAVDYSTTNGLITVRVVDAGMPTDVAAGNWINLVVPVSIGGIVVQGLVLVTNVPSGTSFEFDWTSPAAATVPNAGVVPQYTTTNLSATIKVTLPNHGVALNDIWTVHVGLTIATVVLASYSEWAVTNVIDANNFEFLATAANANTAVFENTGNARIEYLIPTGYATAVQLVGFGVGLFGSGFFGTGGSGKAYSTIRQWFLDQWGQDLIGNYPASPVYVWIPPVAGGNRAIAIDTTNFPSATSPPATVNVTFVSMPQQILMALGCDPSGGGSQDPNLIRWCNIADFTDWVATAVNQAGSFRIPTGSRLIGGITGPTFGVVWTDVDMYIFNYIGFPLVFGFNRISGGVGLLAGRCRVIAQSQIYFASSNGIYRFNGSSVQYVDCPVWDVLWENLDRIQVDKCNMGVNSWFQELMLFFPSAGGTGEVDSYIRYNWRENVWDYGAIGTLKVRLSWQDASPLGPPMGIDAGGLIQQHEIAYDADGQQMMEFIQSGFFTIDNGWLFTMLDQVSADFKWKGTNPSLLYAIITYDPITGATAQSTDFTATPGDLQQQTINMAGRLGALRIGRSSIGSKWRMGNFRYLYAPDGQL